MSEWIQHISGQGQKYKRHPMGDTSISWCVESGFEDYTFKLPLADYVICNPPEAWKDVTGDCTISSHNPLQYDLPGKSINFANYRLRKVPFCGADSGVHEPEKRWAFIVEKRIS